MFLINVKKKSIKVKKKKKKKKKMDKIIEQTRCSDKWIDMKPDQNVYYKKTSENWALFCDMKKKKKRRRIFWKWNTTSDLFYSSSGKDG